MIKFMKIQTNLGSGLEMIILTVGAFVWSSRPKFFYYLTMFCIDRALTCMIKLSYAQPRPYLENLNIKAYQCPTEFGNPSGHSSASMGVAIVLFLDVFHGQTRGVLKFYSAAVYYPSFIFGIYWLVSIPITRIVLGVHSFDQVIFG
jgi:membrane-associated phospholipid phosphatase